MIIYKELEEKDIDFSLFASFDRMQIVTKCWRRINGEWLIKDVSFVDNWSEEKYEEEVLYLRNLLSLGGYVIGAFDGDKMKGFASVEATIFGATAKYMDLSNIHVSQELRGQGIGKALFNFATTWAKKQGAEKLYISAHSSIESQAFYKAMGCVEATEYSKKHVEEEPYDCQLEYVL